VARVPEIDQAAAGHDTELMRAVTRAALVSGVAAADVAESVVAYADERLLAGDVSVVDMCMFHAVHDGVPPSALFSEIKKLARKPKETA
jgi:hypothetical protein